MTSYREEAVECGVCGTQNQCLCLCSVFTRSTPYLDDCPRDRSLLQFWIQECTECGYVAADLASVVSEEEGDRVFSNDYQELRTDTTYSALANRFLCQAFLAELREDWVVAAKANLRAAWVCDGRGEADLPLGRECRLHAEVFFRKAEEAGTLPEEEPGYWRAIRVDILRRADAMDTAAVLCRRALRNDTTLVIARLLKFQQTRIEEGDSSAYTTGEALNPAELHSRRKAYWTKLMKKYQLK